MNNPDNSTWTEDQLKRLQILKDLIELEKELGINDYDIPESNFGIEEDPED